MTILPIAIDESISFYRSAALAATFRSTAGGGYTYILPGRQSHRYVVGNNAFSIKANELKSFDIFRMMLTASVLGLDGAGTWLDTETGTWYIDAIKTFAELDDAILEAKRNGETAIYDTTEQKDIRI